MTERLRNPRAIYNQDEGKMGPKKTAVVFVVVVGCFAVLWPKVFYPMLVGSANQHIKPSPIDRQSGCCDVISELDIKTIKIMSEICGFIKKEENLNNKQMLLNCRSTVLETCGIDISAVLQEQVRLGQSVKQIIDEVRSLNGSLCLKYNFGVSPSKLGVPHRVLTNPSIDSIRQERPSHLREEMIHPAFRERGRAIPQPQASSLPTRPPPRIVSGREEESNEKASPGPIPGLRPTIGGAGHVVPAKQQSVGGSMGLIMPIYTIAIVVFFSYTVIKLFTKKKPETGDLYPHVEPDPVFRREVFETQRTQRTHPTLREGVSSKLVVNAMSALLDEVDEELEARRKASQLAQETHVSNGTLSNGKAVIPEENEEQPSVKVLGMEVTASREDEKKWNRRSSPLVPHTAMHNEPQPPPQEIFLEGALPSLPSHLLVTDSTTEPDNEQGDNESVVLASKMTLSVISLDSSENGTDESSSDKKSEQMVMVEDDDIRGSSNGSDDFEKIEAEQLEDQINDIIEEAQIIGESQLKKEDELIMEKHERKNVENKNYAELERLPIHTDIRLSHPAQGQLVEEIEEREISKKPESNVEEIINTVEVEEIVQMEEPVVLEDTVIDDAKEKPKEIEQTYEKEKFIDKVKSSASSETVEDVEELLSRDDEVDEANDEIEYEEDSNNGSEEELDNAQKDERISEKEENEQVTEINTTNENKLDSDEPLEVDDVDGIQEMVSYVDDDDDENVEEEEIEEEIEEVEEEEEESENEL